MKTNSITFRKCSKKVRKWLDEEYKIEKDIKLDHAIKLVALTIPLYSISYLSTYYGHFGISYFIYFNALDFLRIVYDNSHSLITTLIIFSVMFFIMYLVAVERKGKLKWNKILLIILGILVLLFPILFLYSNFIKEVKLVTIIMLCITIFGIIYSISHLKSFKALLYISLTSILFSSFVKANRDSLITQKVKPVFEIISKGNELFLSDSLINCSYYIGNTTSYVFIFDGEQNKIRALDRSEIKEFRFKIKSN